MFSNKSAMAQKAFEKIGHGKTPEEAFESTDLPRASFILIPDCPPGIDASTVVCAIELADTDASLIQPRYRGWATRYAPIHKDPKAPALAVEVTGGLAREIRRAMGLPKDESVYVFFGSEDLPRCAVIIREIEDDAEA